MGAGEQTANLRQEKARGGAWEHGGAAASRACKRVRDYAAASKGADDVPMAEGRGGGDHGEQTRKC
jgi:hypothetical protein